jgi:hypothetical protein
MLPPRIGVERADPAVARRARAEEDAAERERLERDRELEKEMRELLPSEVAISKRWRKLDGRRPRPRTPP